MVAKIQLFQCAFCPKTLDSFVALSRHVTNEHASESGTQSSAANQTRDPFAPPPGLPRGATVITGDIPIDDYVGGAYLKGSDVPDGVSVLKVGVLQFINDPKGMSKLAVQINETYGKTLFGLNTTNARALQSHGIKNLKDIMGKTLVLTVGMQPNPQRGGALVKSLFVTGLE
jgi:hypothetical protein